MPWFLKSDPHILEGFLSTLRHTYIQITSGVYELTRRPGCLFPSFSISLFIRFFFFCRTSRHAGSSFPDQNMDPVPLEWKCTVLTSSPPGKSLLIHSFCSFLSFLSFMSPFLPYHLTFIHSTNISRPLWAPPGATGKMRR